MANSIIHFEIPADDINRARTFYKQVFGWKISDPWKMDYFMVETRKQGEDGINGGMMTRKMPGQPFMNYIGVKSIDAAMAKVLAAGGVVGMPKMEIGSNMGWIAAFKDPEGNLIGLHEAPKGARKAAAKKAAPKAKAAKSKAKAKKKAKGKAKRK